MAYEFDGRKYAEASAHQQAWGEGMIAGLALAGDEHILDLGCGDGRLTAELAALVPEGEVLGIDASEGMISVAQEKAGGNLRFALADITVLAYGAAFDLIFSNAALHWVLDHEALLPRVRRALREGGRIRLNFGGGANVQHLLAAIRAAMALPDYAAAFAGFTWPWYFPEPAGYAALVEGAGFREVAVWEENRDRFFPSQEVMLRWVDQPCLVPFLAHLPEGSRPGFRAAVHERMVTSTRQGDGRCFEIFRRINVVAQR